MIHFEGRNLMKKTILMLFLFCGMARILCADDISIKPEGRQCFLRNETGAILVLKVVNSGTDALKKLQISGKTGNLPARSVRLGELKAGTSAELRFPMETRLFPGKYRLDLEVSAEKAGKTVVSKAAADYQIGPLYHDAMPVVMWGGSGYKSYQEIGFTHQTFGGSGSHALFGMKSAVNRNRMKSLDQMLADGFRVLDNFGVSHYPKYVKRYPRFNREGKPENNLEASNPGAREMCRKVAEDFIRIYGGHPALDGALVNSEIRDRSQPSFGKVEPAAFRKFAGCDIPLEVKGRLPPPYSWIKEFPVSRVIPDNFPLLVYYRWFWKTGDGWNSMNSLLHDTYKKHVTRPFWTFYDPAVRVPPIWGSGGHVDYLNHWTYATPDPINIAVNTAQLQAMAAGRPGQGIMNMTQIITYRSMTAPIGQTVKNEPAWVRKYPRGRYITLAPDMMREAVWAQLSKRTSGIMFHGASSLVDESKKRGYNPTFYVYTNPETKDVLKKLLSTVVKPLGPALKRVQERKPEVAILESFASAMFAGRCNWGWTGWSFDAHLLLLWANLSPAVVYEETLLRDGFGNLKVLVMPDCDILPESVFKAVQDFQRKGGIIVADENLVPRITPDILLPAWGRSGNFVQDKKDLQNAGRTLRKQLEPYFQPYSDSSDPDLVTWVRTSGETDYLFVINDKRTFGDYIGQYGKVMEKGLPITGTVTVRRKVGAVYDPVEGKAVPFEYTRGKTVIPVRFSSSGGKLFLLLPEKIGRIKLDIPFSAKNGGIIQLKISLETVSGKPVKSIHPIQIEVRDNEGKLTCDSTSAALENGIYSQSLTIPLNAAIGQWKIKVVDSASGNTAEQALTIR